MNSYAEMEARKWSTGAEKHNLLSKLRKYIK